MTDVAPVEDLELLEIAAVTALSSYAENGGGFHPFGVVTMTTGLAIIPSNGFSNQTDKVRFVNGMRLLSIENSSPRAAFAMEIWTMIENDPAAKALLDEIYARGGSMSKHPNAGEAILVIVESDAGTSTRYHQIVRDGDTVTLETGETQFDSYKDQVPNGVLAGFHVPTEIQSKPASQRFAEAMRQTISTHYTTITPEKETGASKAN